ncbi:MULTISPECIES: hypothetical protein [Sorangium]|uniref:Secreted protein n=1 Tax=Sorangium cellulosum TaxID=56 RepID=A0A4P2QYL8_SORCE|nr:MULTISPECIES: hypothetical protein [Sorangium]AUX35690.1 hypothetical protein SOCE836_078880 [Sorangium cellulosum]WCQ94991.1 hypothetical protein NQZ70_07766 [Sorangium sp. Soce836]
MKARSATACTLAAWLAGCQVLAPLPGEGGEGGTLATDGGSVETDGDAGDTGDASRDSGPTPPPAPTPPSPPPQQQIGPCEIAECSTHCVASVDRCELAPQYPSVEACCAVCEAMPSPAGYAACRPAETGDPAGCTGAGPLGPDDGGGCVGRCEALCTLYAALCPLRVPDRETCTAMCSLWPAPDVFNACSRLRAEGTLECRMQLIFAALDDDLDEKKRDQLCRDILQGRCRDPKCEDGGDDD